MTAAALQAHGDHALQRRKVRIRGLVQGVGFRPHVYRSALRFGVTGFVRNDPEGVVIECEGQHVDAFIAAVEHDAPPLSRIDRLLVTSLELAGEPSFEIQKTAAGAGAAAIPADVAICDDCLGELFDPSNRRYLHPFIACTNCGPRFTMTRRLPYDRDATAMDDFALCDACSAEYTDPADRRFHAEPIACHHCGPTLSLAPGEIAAALVRGEIVAIKGIGGFHLACNAHDDAAVRRLRARKQRDGKPFAVMVLNEASAQQWVELDSASLELLSSRARPVTILPARPVAGLSQSLSPGLETLGLMLPYTGIHYLVFHALLGQPAGQAWLDAPNGVALVMTSANVSGDPLVVNGSSGRLDGIADWIADHDREIVARADDSVARIVDGSPMLVRRSRGFTPQSIPLASSGPNVLALGAYLKSTITFARGDRAYLSQHIGDLEMPETLAFHAATVRGLEAMLQATPEVVACDLHRDFGSTHLAERIAAEAGIPLVRVQHHHAHIAAVLAEHRHTGAALGLALDGHGEGPNGAAWGGELLRLTGGDFDRIGHLAPLAAPGGDRAAREPWRMAAAVLHRLGRTEEIPRRFASEPLAPMLAPLLARGDLAQTTSAGRLFDAAAGLLGVSRHAAFEGEPPMLLEALVRELRSLEGGFELCDGELGFDPLLNALADCKDPQHGAELFHGTLIDALCAWTLDAVARTGISTVALGGGCLLNLHLASQLPRRLRAAGLSVLMAEAVPPNDGGISLGQAWVARQLHHGD